MRSVLTAAIAATLVTFSLSLGYAESAGHGSKSGDSSHTGQSDWNNKDNHLITDPTDMTGMFFLHEPLAKEVMQPSPLLTQIDTDLDKAAKRAEVARRHGSLTAEEATRIRDEQNAIRETALTQIRQHDGQLPEDGYQALQGRIIALNELIDRYSHA